MKCGDVSDENVTIELYCICLPYVADPDNDEWIGVFRTLISYAAEQGVSKPLKRFHDYARRNSVVPLRLSHPPLPITV